MMDFIGTLPLWFSMMIISAVVLTLIIVLARADRIKAGPIEIDCEDSNDKSEHGEEVQKISESGAETAEKNQASPEKSGSKDSKKRKDSKE